MIASARVAARTREIAAAIMGQALGRPLLGAPFTHPEEGAILQGFGQTLQPEGLISYTQNDGKVVQLRPEMPRIENVKAIKPLLEQQNNQPRLAAP